MQNPLILTLYLASYKMLITLGKQTSDDQTKLKIWQFNDPIKVPLIKNKSTSHYKVSVSPADTESKLEDPVAATNFLSNLIQGQGPREANASMTETKWSNDIRACQHNENSGSSIDCSMVTYICFTLLVIVIALIIILVCLSIRITNTEHTIKNTTPQPTPDTSINSDMNISWTIATVKHNKFSTYDKVSLPPRPILSVSKKRRINFNLPTNDYEEMCVSKKRRINFNLPNDDYEEMYK